MTLPIPRRWRSDLSALGGLLVLQVLIYMWARKTGFTAISDDDYARVVISQSFAAAPTWDPSGTSWLPFPFLHQGVAMMLFSATLDFARIWAFVCAISATFVLYAAVKRCRVRVPLAFAAAAGGALLPTAVYLSTATVPEYLTAALVVFALTTLLESDSRSRAFTLGGSFLLLATASRYEAWPIAFVFASLRLLDAIKARSPGPLWSVGLALFFPGLWILHGIVDHGNAFFFVKRVVDYKNALGGSASGAEAGLAYFKALFLAEPEAIFVTISLTLLAVTKRHVEIMHGRWLRAWLPLLVMLLVLAVGAMRNGAPTHHEERALLPIWLFSVLTCASLIEHAHLSWTKAALFVVLGLGLGLGLRSADIFEREGFTDRRDEEALGKRLRALGGAQTRIGLDLDDYGYFAVMAAAGHPHRFEVFDTHDPRARVTSPSPSDRYRAQGGCLFVEPQAHPTGAEAIEIERFSDWSIRKFVNCYLPVTENSSK